MSWSNGRFGRGRLGCGCLMLVVIAAIILTVALLWREGRQLSHRFTPELRQDITLDFLRFSEKQHKVNKLVLLERQTREKLVKTVNNTYRLPAVDGLEFSGSATMSIDCPVLYSYYVDLKDPWRLTLNDGVLTVAAPPLRLSRPAVDVGRIKREIQGGWLVFGEDRMLQDLEREMVLRLYRNALKPENLDPLRTACRASLADFIRTWIASGRSEVRTIRIAFAGEKEPVPVGPETPAAPAVSAEPGQKKAPPPENPPAAAPRS